MPSITDVVNVSLRLVGAGRIVNLTADLSQARAASDLIDEVIDDLLRQHAWNFATKRARLAQLTATPEFEFDHAYQLPQDWLRTISVHSDENARQIILFREEMVGDKKAIVTSADVVYMRYVARIVDPNAWSADFRKAVSTTLARDLAIPLANSNSLMKLLDERSRSDVARARSTDAMGASPERRPRGSWVRSRGAHRPQPGTVED